MTTLQYQLEVEKISLKYVVGEITKLEYMFRMQSLQEQYYAMERRWHTKENRQCQE